MRKLPALVALAGLVSLTSACDGTDPSALDRAASIEITMADSILFGTSLAVAAAVRDADAALIDDGAVQWSSSNPAVLRFDPDARAIKAVRPGSAIIRARAGSARDSLTVRVSTVYPGCSSIVVLGDDGSNFRWSFVTPGLLANAHGEPVQYMQTPTLYSAGIMYGTEAATTVSAIYPANPRNDFSRGGFACKADDGSPYHAIFGLHPTSPSVPGLSVISDVYAFDTEDADDFILMSYSFTNDSTGTISHLSVGMGMDMDLYEPDTNVASFDPASGVADVAAQDSVGRPIIAGLMVADEPPAAYRAYLRGSPQETPADLYRFMTEGMVGPNRTVVGDVRQILAIAPFDLQPGETRTVWFALVGGENRTAFNAHVEEAVAKVRSMQQKN